MDRICYMNPAFGAPYGEVDRIDYYSQTASGYSLMNSRPYNPFEDAYRVALNNLEDSCSRQRDLLYRYSGGDPYYMNRDLYELESWFHLQRDRLERQMKESVYNSQRYYYSIVNQGYGYGLQRQRWEWPVSDYSTQLIPYQYTYTYLNSKETTKVPTETKKFIIISSAGTAPNPIEHKTLAEAEAEATRLAKQFPKQEFTVYETRKSFKVADKPVDVKVFV